VLLGKDPGDELPAAADADLVEDGFEVLLHGEGRDGESGRDLACGVAAEHEKGQLHLAVSQSVRLEALRGTRTRDDDWTHILAYQRRAARSRSADLARGRGLRSVAGQEERPGSWGEGPIAEACGSPSDRRLGLARPSALAVLRLMMSSNAHWGRQS